MDELFTQGLFALFFVISVGLMLGRVKIKGFSLDVSGVIFIAMLLGYWGVEIPKMFQNFGILLFIFTVGIQSGPTFFATLFSDGKKPIFLTAILVCTGALLSVVLCYVFGLGDVGSILGVFNGGMASSIGLAASIDIVPSAKISLDYSLIYPFGVVITILFFQLLPTVCNSALPRCKRITLLLNIPDKLSSSNVLPTMRLLVTNSHIFSYCDGKSISSFSTTLPNSSIALC